MNNRKVIGLLGIAAAMMDNYIDLVVDDEKKPVYNRYAGKLMPDKSSKSASRIVKKTIPREGPKIGRNDKCKCGSGQKYKNCCLDKDKKQKWLL